MLKRKVSIIVPFHNAEGYLDRCIESLLGQTYKTIEIIFVDDMSEDNSRVVLSKAGDKRIEVYNTDKPGVSCARNYGIKRAQGHYIAFADVDDTMQPDCIERFVAAAEEHKSDVVISAYNEMYTDGLIKKVELPWKDMLIGTEEIENSLIPQMIYHKPGETAIRGVVWRTFVTREFLSGNNISFVENLRIAEDLLFVIQAYHRCGEIYVIGDALYNYHMNDNSTLNRYIPENISNRMFLNEKMYEILQAEGLYEANKDRYELQYMRMYTYSMSNAVRSKSLKTELSEMKRLRTLFLENPPDYMNSDFSAQIKLSLFLLDKGLLMPLITMYRTKEKLRRSKLR